MNLRGALFGCGMISEFHLRAWNRIPNVQIVALCNRTLSRAQQRRDEFVPKARVYSDVNEMLAAEKLDFLDILTTPELHREHCLIAMRAGLHVICQKPLCATLNAARSLVNEVAGYPKVFAVHENHRYRPWFRDVRRRFKQGLLGRASFLRVEHLNATEPEEKYKTDVSHGVLLEYGSHLVDMMRSLLGEPSRVHARMHHLNPGVNGESMVHAMYEYPNITAVIDAGWKHAALTQGSVLLACDEGEAWYEGTLTRGEQGRLRLSHGKQVIVDRAISPIDEYVESFYLFQRECVDAMLARGHLVQTGQEHLRTLTCTFAAYKSASTGQVVECEA